MALIDEDNQFLGTDPNAGGFLTEEIIAPVPSKGQITTKERQEDLKHNTGLTDDELAGLVDANAIAFSHISSQELAPVNSTGLLEALVEDGATLEELEAAADKKAEIDKALTDVQEITTVDVALAEDPSVSGAVFRIEHRAGRARKTMLDMAEEFEDGFAGQVLGLIDQIGYDTYTGMRDVVSLLSFEGGEEVALADEWQVALSSYSDEEFEQFYRGRLETITNSPHSSDGTSWLILREVQAMEAAGAVLWGESTGALMGAVSALDVATLGVTGVKTMARAGKSVVGRLRSTAGTTRATEAAAGSSVVVRGGKDGEVLNDVLPNPEKKFNIKDDIIDAEFIDDAMPSAAGTRVYPSATPPPPVSAGKVSQAVAGNMFIRRFLQRQAARSFGTVNLAETAANWAKTEADRLAKVSGTNVIDYDTAVEGVQQARTTFTFGRDDAMPFKTKESAENIAKNIPNSVVTPIKGKEGAEFVIKVETRVPLRDTVGATDLSKVKARTRLGRLLGRADLGTSTFFSNLADASDYGALGFQQDFNKTIKSLNKLPKRDTQAIDTILTTLRDTPNGGSVRTWLTTEDFVDSFKSLTGELPSKATIQGYEDLIEASDFSWYIRANDRLSTMANQKAVMIKAGDVEVTAFPPAHGRTVKGLKQEKGPIWVYDATLGKRLNVTSLGDDAPLMELSTPTSDGSQFITNFYGKTRIPELEDAFPYNAGGPRTNPDITWFVGNDEGNWATLIGARTEKEAAAATKQFNTISQAVAKEVGDDVKALEGMSRNQKKRLTAIVRANNEWNPNIEDIDDFIAFTKTRGVPASKPVHHRERGARLGGFVDTNDESLINIDLESYISFHRHDQALVQFGGEKASNPDPILAIHRQYNQMVTRGAQMQYRMNHPTAWVKAVQKASKDKNIESLDEILHPMTDEMKVRTLEIKGNTEAAKKLRQEQSVILRRLDMFEGSQSSLPTESLGTGATRAAVWAGDVLHNFAGSNGVSRWLQKSTTQGASNKLLTLGFFQKMASFDQVLLQASHFIPMTAISPVNAGRGFQIASVVRQAARGEGETVWKAALSNLKRTTGLDDNEMNALMEHMLDSGRGYMRGAVAEDPMAGMGNSMLGKVKDIASAPYYAGENFSATMSRVVAFLDTRKSFPSLDPKSNAFWNAVASRDRDLSFALNKAQKSEIQTDAISRVLTQWTSYPLRTIESIVFNNNLKPVERARLAATTTMLWGLSGVGLYGVAANVRENQTFGFMSNMIAEGADVGIDGLAGIKVGDRLAFNPIELFERAANMATLNLSDAVPAATILSDTTEPALSAIMNFGSGRIELGAHDLQTLARAWKVVDSGVMAYNMRMNDVRRSKSGSAIYKDFTSSQEFFQFIGIKPSEATDKFATSSLLYDQKKKKDKAIEQATPAVKLAMQAAKEGNYRKAQQFMLDANAIVEAYGLTPTRQAEVRESVFQKADFDDVNWTVLQMIKDGYTDLALEFKENFAQ